MKFGMNFHIGALIHLIFALWVSATIIPDSTLNHGVIKERENIDNKTIPVLSEAFPSNVGLYLRVSQRALDYFVQTLTHVAPAVLVNYTLPDSKGATYSIKGVKITEFTKPIISAKFIQGQGIKLDIQVPLLQIRGSYEVGISWFSKKGSFLAEVTNFHLDTLIKFEKMSREQEKENIEFPKCVGHTETISLAFSGDLSTMLNTFRGYMESYLIEELDAILCELISDMTETDENSDMDNQSSASENFGLKQICKPDEDSEKSSETVSPTTSRAPRPRFGVKFWPLGLPIFFNNSAVAGIGAEVTYGGLGTHGVNYTKVEKLNPSNKMISVASTEYISNTFLYHVYNFGIWTTSFGADDLPFFMKYPLKLVCGGCELRFLADISERPFSIMTEQGVQVNMKGNAKIIAEGPFRQFDMVKGSAIINLLVKPNLEPGNDVKIDVDLLHLNVRVHKDAGIGAVLGNQLASAIRYLLPKKFWPMIKEKLDNILKEQDTRIPNLCGMKLSNPEFEFHRNSLMLNTDVEFDSESLIRKMKKKMRRVENKRATRRK